MLGTFGGAAIGDDFCEFLHQFLDHFRVFSLKIVLFGRILFQVVELDRWKRFVFQSNIGFGSTPAAGAWTKVELPVASTDGEAAGNGVMDEALAGLVGTAFAFQGMEEADGVFRDVGLDGFLCTNDLRRGSKEVDSADQGIRFCPFFDLGRPTNMEGDSVAAFKDVSFVTTPVCVRKMPFLDQIINLCRWGASVVCGKQDQGVFRDVLFIQLLQHFANNPIRLHDKISVFADL